MAKILICANKLKTCGLIYLYILIDMPYVVQKILPYILRDRNMTISFTLIYIWVLLTSALRTMVKEH